MDFNIYLIVTLLITQSVNSARIFAFLPISEHESMYQPLMDQLLTRGHKITVITTHPKVYEDEYLDMVDQIEIYEEIYLPWKISNSNSEESLPEVMAKLYDTILSSDNVQDLINRSVYFDVCLISAHAYPAFPMKDIFNCSLILISSISGSSSSYRAMGNPLHPVISNFPDPSNTTLIERTRVVLQELFYQYIFYVKWVPICDEIARNNFVSFKKSVYDIENEADFLFSHEHYLIDGVKPTVPAVIQLYGMHIREPSDEVAPNLQKLLDESDIGVIYFSLGSSVKPHHFSKRVIDMFLKVFAAIPYPVLWKWDSETLAEKSDNVHMSRWLPQQDILAHRNVKLFITQGEQRSMEESIHYKTPLVGIPLSRDHNYNVDKCVRLGVGIGLNIYTLSQEKIIWAINEVMNNISYYEKISNLSNLLNDQPMTSMELAVWWTEYAARYKGEHLKSTVNKMPLYQYLLMDVIIFLMACALGIFSCVCFFLWFAFKVIGRNRKKIKCL